MLTLAQSEDLTAEIEAFLKLGQFEETAECLLEVKGSRAFSDALDQAYGDRKLKDLVINGAASVIPHPDEGAVITTNFDHVLEETYRKSGYVFEQIVWGTS